MTIVRTYRFNNIIIMLIQLYIILLEWNEHHLAVETRENGAGKTRKHNHSIVEYCTNIILLLLLLLYDDVTYYNIMGT